MAAPAWVSSTAQSSGTTTTTASITLPTTAADDILILTTINGGANAAVTIGGTYNGSAFANIGTPTGWATGHGGVKWSRCPTGTTRGRR